MAQKANLTSIRKLDFINSTPNLNNQIWLLSNQFLKIISQVLKRKDVLIAHKTINFNGSSVLINLSVFFKITKLKKISRFLSFRKLQTKYQVNNPVFKNFVLFVFQAYKVSSLNLKFRILNFFVQKRLTKFFGNRLRKYLKTLFSRRLKLFVDFIQILSLYVKNYVNTKFLLYNIAVIFSRLKKQRHSKFLKFIKELFTLIIFKLPTTLKKKSNKIQGVKILIKGKLRGKTRKKNKVIVLGVIPTQAINLQIEFAKTFVVTSYGVFGIKFWTYRSN